MDCKAAGDAALYVGGSRSGKVTGPEEGRAADGQASDEARDKERVPVPSDGTSQSRDHVKDCQDAQCLSPSPFLAGNARGHRSDDRAEKSHGDCNAEFPGTQPVCDHARMRRAGNNGGVETEEQATQCANDGGSREIGVHSQRLWSDCAGDLDVKRTRMVLISYGFVWTVTVPSCKESSATGRSMRSVSETA